jgi:PII-like signaling protein
MNDQLEGRISALELKIEEISVTLAVTIEIVRQNARFETGLEEVKRDLNNAHSTIRHNKMIIDMIRWSVVLVIPATISVLAAFAVEVLLR